MNILEALKLAHEGKTIKRKGFNWTIRYSESHGLLRFDKGIDGRSLALYHIMTYDWEVVEPPRKYVTFSEAFEFMRNHCSAEFMCEDDKSGSVFHVCLSSDERIGSRCLFTVSGGYAPLTEDMFNSKRWYEVKR